MSHIHDSSSDSLARSSHADGSEHSNLSGDRIDPPEPLATDPLSDVLRAVRLTGVLFFVWDVAWPYVTTVPAGSTFAPVVLPGAQQIISYHVIVGGTAWGGLPGHEPIRFEEGDILLVPRGDAYAMSDNRGGCEGATVDVEGAMEFFRQMACGNLPFVVKEGASDVSTRVVCGFLGCDLAPYNPALCALPSLVRIQRPADPAEDRVQPLLDLALAESRRVRPGSRAMLLRLSELLFIEVVRRCLSELPSSEGGWLAALGDPVAGPALIKLHGHPEHAWTLEALASDIGISRSRLAERFSQCVGQPPMQYLTRWRIQLATRLLSDGAGKVATIAEQVGYGSEAAFSRAFKRCVGVSPSEWRRGV